MKHPDHIVGFNGTIEEAAKAVEQMRYEKTVDFLYALENAFGDRCYEDLLAGKKKLATHLADTVYFLSQARQELIEAWVICEPHMENIDEKE